MLDRASTFANPEIVKLLQERFVPVAIDQAYQRRQKDAEGEFYRKIAGQGPRATPDFSRTTQGLYIATPAGELLVFNNNRGPERIARLMAQTLRDSEPEAGPDRPKPIEAGRADRRFNPEPPTGGLVLRVRAKVLGGYEPSENRWRQIFQGALSRDNCWATREEHRALARGTVPDSFARRLVRFHLVDNTRGEPPTWKDADIRQLDLKLEGSRLTGSVHLETADGSRGYRADLKGTVEARGGNVTRFDAVALGTFWGHGRYTPNPPKGEFPLAVAFSLADGSDTADAIPPQGSRGWVDGYIRLR